MKVWSSRRGLLVLNGVLLGVLVSWSPQSQAQRSPGRARGEYTMVAGNITGSSVHAVYVFDAANQEMVALLWNGTTRSFDGIGYRDLRADAGAAAAR